MNFPVIKTLQLVKPLLFNSFGETSFLTLKINFWLILTLSKVVKKYEWIFFVNFPVTRTL